MTRLLLALPLFCAAMTSHAAGAAFQCGGVGEMSQQRTKAAAANHDALLTFAVSTGAYLADVRVQVRDGKGAVVLEGTCEGPLMLLDLPARGSYQVTATPPGHDTKTKRLAIGGKPARLVFTWPAS